jgi:hypothetical protein
MKKDGFRYITSLGLILTLLYPSIVKFDHHHDHESLPENGNNLQNSHSSCSLCEFQFSTFDKNSEHEYSFLKSIVLLIEKPLYFGFFSKFDNYNFSLRAPPSIFKYS